VLFKQEAFFKIIGIASSIKEERKKGWLQRTQHTTLHDTIPIIVPILCFAFFTKSDVYQV
jgi:hypothetical protein